MGIITPIQAYDLVHRPEFRRETLKGRNVSENFGWLEVFANRSLAEVRGADKTIFINAFKQARIMELVRAHIRAHLKTDAIIQVISWYRSPAANAAAGGANRSSHLAALATDFVVPGIAPVKVQAWLAGVKDSIGFCLEITNGNWTHVDARALRIVFENLGNGRYKTLTPAEILAFRRKHGAA